MKPQALFQHQVLNIIWKLLFVLPLSTKSDNSALAEQGQIAYLDHLDPIAPHPPDQLNFFSNILL